MARELAEAGELEPVSEAVLTRPFSRRALLLSPIVLGLGLVAVPRVAMADSVRGQWVQDRRDESTWIVQTSEHYVNQSPNSDGSYTVWVRTSMYCKPGAGRIRWTTTKTFYDNGSQCGYIGPDYNEATDGSWISESTQFNVGGGGSHHITSTETTFRGSAATTAGWDFWIDIPWTGHVTVTLRPLAYRNGTQFSYPADYRGYMPEGTYLVKLCEDRSKSLNVAGGYADRGTNVHLWQTDLGATAADRLWDLFREGDGRFECMHHATGCALDLADAKAQSHQNVQQWTRNGSAAQRWRFNGAWSLGNDNSILIRSKVNDGYMVDVEPSNTSNGANIDVWDKSDPSAVTCWQRWDPHLVNPDESGTWRDVTELPDSVIRAVDFSGTRLGLYLGDRLLETATVTSTNADYASVRFSTLVTSDTSDWYNVRVLGVPSGLRVQGGMHRFWVRGDLDLSVFLEYAKWGLTFKSIDEDGNVRTSASLSALYAGWPYESFALPPSKAMAPLSPTLSDRELGELGTQEGMLAVSRYWYDRDPRVAASNLLEVGDEITLTGNMTAWMRLPDSVTVHVMSGGEEVLTEGTLRMRDGDSVPGPSSGADAPATQASDLTTLSGPIASDRLWPALAAGLAREWCAPSRVSGWFLDEACTNRVDEFEVGSHTDVWLRLEPYTVTYVVDGRVMATDSVPVAPAYRRSTFPIPAERTAQATREGCTPGFSGWFAAEDDPALTGDEPTGDAGLTELEVTEDITLYGVNRATLALSCDETSAVRPGDGSVVRTSPDDSAPEATTAQLCGSESPVVRRVGSTASLLVPPRLYRRTEAGRYVSLRPHAWHAAGSSSNSSTWVASRDETLYVSWEEGTTDGVAAER